MSPNEVRKLVDVILYFITCRFLKSWATLTPHLMLHFRVGSLIQDIGQDFPKSRQWPQSDAQIHRHPDSKRIDISCTR